MCCGKGLARTRRAQKCATTCLPWRDVAPAPDHGYALCKKSCRNLSVRGAKFPLCICPSALSSLVNAVMFAILSSCLLQYSVYYRRCKNEEALVAYR